MEQRVYDTLAVNPRGGNITIVTLLAHLTRLPPGRQALTLIRLHWGRSSPPTIQGEPILARVLVKALLVHYRMNRLPSPTLLTALDEMFVLDSMGF